MFIVKLTYKKPLDIVDKHLAAHRNFLDKCYEKNALIASGPLIPRTGGILLSQLTDREELIKLLKKDPFHQEDIADFEIMEFDVVKRHRDFAY